MVTVDDFVQAKWYHPGRQRTAGLGVIHCTQSPLRKGAARGVAQDFATRPAANKASAHVTCDAEETIGSVKTTDTALAVPNVNADGFHVEQVGYAEWSVDQWGEPDVLKATVRAAVAMREGCVELGIPIDWLDDEGLAAYERGEIAGGITDHATCSRVLHGDHWDPGPYYHRDQFLTLVRGLPAPPIGDDMNLEASPYWVRDDSELWVITRGTDSAVWCHVFDAKAQQWKDAWFSIGGVALGPPNMAEGANGRLDFTVVSTDHAVWQKTLHQDGQVEEWHSLGGTAG